MYQINTEICIKPTYHTLLFRISQKYELNILFAKPCRLIQIIFFFIIYEMANHTYNIFLYHNPI